MEKFCRSLSVAAVSALCVLAGCGGVYAPPVTVTGTGATTYGATNASVYVIQETTNYRDQVLRFAAGSADSVTPAFTATTTLAVAAVAVDSAGQIYAAGVTSTGAATINIYNPVNNNIQTIALPTQPIAIALDTARNIYVTDTSSEILVYANPAGGSALTRTIAGSATTIATPEAIAVDSAGTVYLSSYSNSTGVSSILLFNSAANGNVAPASTITSPTGSAFFGVAVDAAKNVYATKVPLTTTGVSQVVEYTAGSSGTANPAKTITGSSTLLNTSDVGALAIDSAGNLYLPIASGSSSTSYSVLEFAAGANGNAVPASRVRSSAWTSASAQLAVM